MIYSKCGIFTQIAVGSVFILTSVVMLIIWPSLYSNVLNSKLILTNTSESYDLWRETPIPMYLEIFLYNFTNSEEVMKNPKTVKPHFEEKGPYVFQEIITKIVKDWNDNGTVTFNQRRTWHYQPSKSNGNLSDKITNINVVASTIVNFMKSKPALLRPFVDGVLKDYNEDAVMTHTAGELLFEGYEDQLLKEAANLNMSFIKVPSDRFGWFADRNLSETFDGISNMDTGVNNIRNLGNLQTWNYEHQTRYYRGDCGQVYGATGELFPPGYDLDNITIFATDICSPITLRRDGDLTIRGIQGSMFVGDDWVFDNGHTYPEQKCYCKTDDQCPPWGTRDVGSCKFGAPAFVSYPHFYLADPYYLSKVNITPPSREKDEFQMGLEIGTGIPLLVRAQLQINVLIEHVKFMTVFDNLPDMTYVPMLWFRQEVTLTEDYARQAKLALEITSIVEGILYAFLTLGIILIGVALFVLIKYPFDDSDRQMLIPNE